MQTEKEYTAGREVHALRCESSGEYSLPDYNGDVKKILMIKSKVFPAGKFVGEDALEFSGTVGYDVVYVDSENTVTHAEFSTDYDAAVRIDADTYVDSDVRSEVVHCSMRLIGPRKLSVKCALDNEVYISEKRSYSVEGDAFMEHQPEYMSESAMIFTSAFSLGESKEINEEILTLEGAIADEVEILLSDAHTEVDSVELADGKADLRCRTLVCLLYRNGDEQPKRIEKEIVHTEVLDAYEVEDFDVLGACVDMVSLRASVSPTEDGVSLSSTLVIIPKIYARGNKQLEVITDAYLKERGTDNEYGEISYTEHIGAERTEERFEVVQGCSELDVVGLSDVIYADASARVGECEIADGVVKVSGEIRFSGIACQTNEDGTTIYIPIKFASEFNKNVNINCQTHENMRVFCHAHANGVRIEVDDNLLKASCTLELSMCLGAERRQRCLGASFVTDEEYIKDESVVTVYYPDASESLFEIARKFHTSVALIAQSNRLSESVFASAHQPIGASGVTRLLIK